MSRNSGMLEHPLTSEVNGRVELSPPVAQRIETLVELAAKMTADSTNASSLDQRTIALVRIAALVAIQASRAAYELALSGGPAPSDRDVSGVLIAIAPVVGTARITSATDRLNLGIEKRSDSR